MKKPILPDLICFSHLRWQFVYQRPQHLMVRFAGERRVFYIEESVVEGSEPRLDVAAREVCVVTPYVPETCPLADRPGVIRRLLRGFFRTWEIENPVLWLYTPLAWPFAAGIPASAVVYDCMDELSAFAGASPEIGVREKQLLNAADVVFTGGQSLFEAKERLHRNVHAFPSSVDVAHFGRARSSTRTPEDQREIARPRIGFCGVIDERMDYPLIQDVASSHPEWQFVMIGPVVKVDPAVLPKTSNLHYLGMKAYEELPVYMAGWDVAILPFARNAATRFISPTKTPEYLAAGRPVVSTPIRDVVRPYGQLGMVAIAETAETFGSAIARMLGPAGRQAVEKADGYLASQSWDRTWAAMNALVLAAEARRLDLAARSAVAVAHKWSRSPLRRAHAPASDVV